MMPEHKMHGEGKNTLYGLMRRCGHKLHHGEVKKEEAFNGLSAEEQEQLKTLLTKLLASWNTDEEK